MSVITTASHVFLSIRWYLVALAIGAYVVRLYGQHRRLKAFKGPWTTGWSSYWLVRAVGSYNTHQNLADVCEKHGTLARIGPNLLVTSSPDLIMKMSAARSPYTKSNWYEALKLPPGQDNLFSLRDEKMHTQRKAQMADGYVGKTNPTLESSIDIHILNLVNLIRSKYISTATAYKPMDLGRKASFFTLDVITELAYGSASGFLRNDTDMYRYIQSTEEMLPTMLLMSAIPPLQKFMQIDAVGKALFPSDKSATGIGKVIGMARKLVKERYNRKTVSHQDMMDSFIAHGMNENDLVVESLLQILAGSDTSATAIRATFLYIMSNPQVYSTLRAEIDSAAKEHRISSPVIRDSEAQQLPYLQAVIREGLRIWPPVTGLLSKTCPPAGDEVEIDGKKVFIPGNTDIGWCAWLLMRNTAVFGDDAHVFRPERWLIDDVEQLARMTRTADLVFGYGKYSCLGKNVAGMELNKIFVAILREFDIALVNPEKPWKSGNMGLWMQSEMWVRITKRQEV